MADLIDVQNMLVSIAAAALYPNGTGQASLANCPIRVYAGWPISQTLDEDLHNGICHVSVFPRAAERNTTRYPANWVQQMAAAPTLTLTVNGRVVTVGGTVSTPQNVMLLVNRQYVVYAVQTNDTLTTIAAALAAQVPGATSSGAAITLPTTALLTAARVGATATVSQELRRQEKQFQLTTWAKTPELRDLIARSVDLALAQIVFLSLPDGYSGRLQYVSTFVDDKTQKSDLYRRDLVVSVEYPTTLTAQATQVTQLQLQVYSQVGTTSTLIETLNT